MINLKCLSFISLGLGLGYAVGYRRGAQAFYDGAMKRLDQKMKEWS